jgi:hypothetical protein
MGGKYKTNLKDMECRRIGWIVLGLG